MTKGRAALPATVVAEQDPFFIALSKNTSQGRSADTADLSTPLRSGRDDKGEGGASSNSRCGTGPVFHRLSKNTSQGRSADTADLSTPLRSGRDDKGEGGASSNSRC